MLERTKKFLWHLIEPLFPTVRDIWVFFGFMEHKERQNFLIGYLKKNVTERDFKKYLINHNFTNDYLGWIDPDEILNMRLVVHKPIYHHDAVNQNDKQNSHFKVGIYQYHLRLFTDLEVRGHFEFTTESHPFMHLFERGMVPGLEYFKPLLESMLDFSPLVQNDGALNPK